MLTFSYFIKNYIKLTFSCFRFNKVETATIVL